MKFHCEIHVPLRGEEISVKFHLGHQKLTLSYGEGAGGGAPTATTGTAGLQLPLSVTVPDAHSSTTHDPDVCEMQCEMLLVCEMLCEMLCEILVKFQ